MKTILRDSNVTLPGVRRKGHRPWFLMQADQMGFPVQDTLVARELLKARVDHGRWIVDCPDCKGAECVTLDDPVFMCLSCGNEAIEGKLYKVKFPPSAKRSKVEALLVERPLYAQNWRPEESINQLKKENAKNLREG